ncbi:hypothetical protein AeNC1_019086 [Aphanomyces euteiches]|nr:hypothetical protein AeNC1_019086 [Aphanomyces euteiches]
MPSSKRGRVGRKTTYTPEDITESILQVPEEQLSTLRDLSKATGISKTTICRNLRGKILQRTSSHLKPLLNKPNMMERVAFSPTYEFDGMGCGSSKREMVQRQQGQKKGVPCQRPVCQQTRGQEQAFHSKVMFLAAVARPRHDGQRGVMFNGKIRMWPFVQSVPAAQNSRNRLPGTMVPTLVNVNAEVYRDYVVTKVVPAIKATFPSVNKHVILQHDNATPRPKFCHTPFGERHTKIN